MNVVGTGFLSPEGAAAAREIAAGLQPVLELVEQSVRLCQEGLAAVEVDGQETLEQKQHIAACVMLARLLEITEASLMLARGGFSNQVTSATREFLEAYFLFGNICFDREFVPKYFNSDLLIRNKLMDVASKHKGEPFELLNRHATSEVRTELQEQIKDLEAVELKVYENARRVNCAAIYDSLYRITSAATHSTPRSLAAYVTEMDGIVQEVTRAPIPGDIAVRLHDQGVFLLQVRRAFEELFGLPQNSAVEELNQAYAAVQLPQ